MNLNLYWKRLSNKMKRKMSKLEVELERKEAHTVASTWRQEPLEPNTDPTRQHVSMPTQKMKTNKIFVKDLQLPPRKRMQ